MHDKDRSGRPLSIAYFGCDQSGCSRLFRCVRAGCTTLVGLIRHAASAGCFSFHGGGWSRANGDMFLFPAAPALGDTTKPVEKDGAEKVEDDIHPQKAKIPPRITRAGPHAGQEDVGVFQTTVGAAIGIQDVASLRGHIWCHELAARLSDGRSDMQVFVTGAGHLRITHGGGEKTLDQVCKWRDPVQKDPETGQSTGSHQHTVPSLSVEFHPKVAYLDLPAKGQA